MDIKLRLLSALWFGLCAILGFLVWFLIIFLVMGFFSTHGFSADISGQFKSIFGYSWNGFFQTIFIFLGGVFFIGAVLGFLFSKWIIRSLTQAQELSENKKIDFSTIVVIGITGGVIYLFLIDVVFFIACNWMAYLDSGLKGLGSVFFEIAFLVIIVIASIPIAGWAVLPAGILAVYGFKKLFLRSCL